MIGQLVPPGRRFFVIESNEKLTSGE